MNLHQDMDREQMRMAILGQEQIFRHQVHKRHRLYHVQKQLMHQAQTAAPASRASAPVVDDIKPRAAQQLDIWCGEKSAMTTTAKQQIISFTSCKTTTTPALIVLAEECNLELTLSTGPNSSNSNRDSCGAERRQGKRLKASSNSDSELVQFREVDLVTVRFHGEVGRKMDETGQGPWMYQCLSLKKLGTSL